MNMNRIALVAVLAFALAMLSVRQLPAATTCEPAPDYAEPIADVGLTTWTESVGNGNGIWYDELDDGYRVGRGRLGYFDDDNSYWRTDVVGEPIEVLLSPIAQPAPGETMLLRVSQRTDIDGPLWIPRILAFTIRDGEEVIVQCYALGLNKTGYNDAHCPLSAEEIAKITDFGNLHVRLWMMTPGSIRLSSIELEIVH